jgi:hypothetical protein
MTASIRFGMVDLISGKEQPKRIAGKMVGGFPCIYIRGAELDVVLKGFTAGQLQELRDVAAGLLARLENQASG